MDQEIVVKQPPFSSKRATVGVAILLCIAVVAGVLWLLQQRTIIRPFMIGDDLVRLEITQSVGQRERGLSGRTSIGEADGLLFKFPEAGRHGIWMKEMQFDIDIMWVSEGKIVDIAPRVPYLQTTQELPVYYPRAAANWVIEFPAGTVEQKGWKIGDTVTP
ncbi:hypothetical protein A3H75_00380 [Candidatus Uhrbacteria bacterium RIFCSPLOWO2_02_FULL_51_9]|uniref:DUF192 domain-containing protein n=1 Tax=Candidatus Uhrbacteria bacterium RIFCSPLOWO2_02_FULL_51_9 TaxID=1802410 RepID=A0A1F7VDX2_9BACT|nr:MAG: hypothetical protein A3H75_00380 [Candidatus Uhrbacteria bacterium RIFCSPLOWO2_02_FULL_51_9]